MYRIKYIDTVVNSCYTITNEKAPGYYTIPRNVNGGIW